MFISLNCKLLFFQPKDVLYSKAACCFLNNEEEKAAVSMKLITG